MRSTLNRRQSAKRWLKIAACFVMLALAGPAAATLTIQGVTEGQVVSEPLRISAVSQAAKNLGVTIHLTGPEDTQVLNRTADARVHLIEAQRKDSDGRMQTVAGFWDPTEFPEGEYNVAAYATQWREGGRKVVTVSVNFTVQHEAEDGDADGDSDTDSADQSSPSPEDLTADSQASGKADADNAAASANATPSSDSEVLASETVNEAEPQVNVIADSSSAAVTRDTSSSDASPTRSSSVATNRAQRISSSGPTVANTRQLQLKFADDSVSRRRIGDDTSIALEFTGQAASNSDVLVVAWNSDRSEMVEGFGLSLQGDILRVTSQRLDTLPAANLELRAYYRVNQQVRMTATHALANLAADVEVAAIPEVSFADDQPLTFTQGAASAIDLSLGGPMPDTGDILVLAWSVDDNRLVDGVARVLRSAPYQVSAEMLNELPVGRHEIRVYPRRSGAIDSEVSKSVTVTASSAQPIVSESSTASESESLSDPLTPTTSESEVTTPPNATPTVVETPTISTPQTPDVSADSDDDIEISFASETRTQYTKGSGVSIAINASGELPNGADILMLVWHNEENQAIAAFTHELKAAPYSVDSSMLDLIPTGSIQLQALLRVPGQTSKMTSINMTVVSDEPAQEEEVEETQTPVSEVSGIDFSGMNLSDEGFTVFTESADTMKVYVSASGDDDNDGLSPSTPKRTPAAGYALLRDGYPDWLLFKAGDTFTESLGYLRKSGRGAEELQLIGVYGEGARPKFLTTTANWAFRNFHYTSHHIAIVGLEFVATNRDTSRSDFRESDLDGSWNQSCIVLMGAIENFLIEDCVVQYYKFGLVFQSVENSGYSKNIQVRRNVIRYSYGHHDGAVAGHSSGIYMQYAENALIEDNVLDHNGWNPYVDGAERTMFNHNAYIQRDCKPVAWRNNISTNAASHGLQLRPGGEVSDSFFSGNPLAFFVARHESLVEDNVVMRSNDINEEGTWRRGYGITILPTLHATVRNNIVTQKSDTVGTGWALEVADGEGDSSYAEWMQGRDYKVSLSDNKVYDWPTGNGDDPAINFRTGFVEYLDDTRNHMHTSAGGSSDPPWVDPDRDVESYMASIGQTPTLQAFLDAASSRPRGQWVEEFTASALNHYIRRGFDTVPFD